MDKLTNRELLERAAKAAGIGLAFYDEESGQWFRDEDDPEKVRQTGNGYGSAVFDPLDDDGDAFRLAITLKLDVQRSTDGRLVYAGAGGEAPYVEYVSAGVNEFAAARRVIVRAAAEIGKGMA